MKLAQENMLKSIAFPALGIGINQVPVLDSAEAFRSAIDLFEDLYDLDIRLVVRDSQTLEVFSQQPLSFLQISTIAHVSNLQYVNKLFAILSLSPSVISLYTISCHLIMAVAPSPISKVL